MTKKSINIEFIEYSSTDELNESLKALSEKSESHLSNAYAPYSNFRVAAMCVLEDGAEIIGTNQENAAYPSGLCAERVAVFSAKAQFPDKRIDKLVLATSGESESPLTPCGACRQVLIEYEQQQNQAIQIILKSVDSKIWIFNSVKDLLPFAFDSSVLKKQ